MTIQIKTRHISAGKSRLVLHYYIGHRHRVEPLNLLIIDEPKSQTDLDQNECSRHVAEVIKIKRELRIK